MKDKLNTLVNASPALALASIPKGWTVHKLKLSAGRIARIEFERLQTYYTATFNAGKVTLERTPV